MKKQLGLSLKKLLFLIGLFSITNTYAQDKQHEIGLRLSSLNSFDFIYKKNKKLNKYTRHRLAFTNITYQRTNQNSFNLSVGYAIGVEKRRGINAKLSFVHGFEPSIILIFRRNSTNNQFRTQLNLGYILGFQYDFSESLYINLESIPSLTGNFALENGRFDENYQIKAGFNSTAIAITLAYRFDSKNK